MKILLLNALAFFTALTSELMASENLAIAAFKRDAQEAFFVHYPILKKRRYAQEQERTLDVQSVATYLLKKDLGIHNENPQHQKIDFTKLQQLLYISQSYSWAIYGKRLFEGSFTRDETSFNTPKIMELLGNETQQISDEQIQVMTLEESLFSEQQKAFLDCILTMYSDMNTVAIEKELAKASPAKGPAFREEVKEQEMQDQFRSLDPWLRFVVQLLARAKSNDDIVDLLSFAREYLSYNCVEYSDITKVKERFTDERASIERILDLYWSSSKFVQWPGQTRYEAFMGQLFFPLQYEVLFELPSELQLRENLQYMLAISCFFKNLAAYHDMAEILCLFDADEPEYNDSEVAVLRFFGQSALQKIRECIDPNFNGTLPYHLCGLLCLQMLDNKTANIFFLKGFAQGEPWSTFYCGTEAVDKEQRDNILQILSRLSDLGKSLALFLQSQYQEENDPIKKQECIELYEEAGKRGVGAAYISAAALVEDQSKRIELFKEAARSGLLSSCDKLVDLYKRQLETLDASDINGRAIIASAIEDVYLNKAKSGDKTAFICLAELHKKLGNMEKALAYYHQAGILGKPHLADNASSKEKKSLKKDARRSWKNHVNTLKQLIAGE